LSEREGSRQGDDPIAWTAIVQHEEVVASDGEKVGTVGDVLGTGETGIFHGLAVRTHHFQHEVEVPADSVESITESRIILNIDTDAFKALPQYKDEPSFTLGITGLFRHKPGWREDEPRR
jgi:sporulation protein YlmC with PRC-barrel domain